MATDKGFIKIPRSLFSTKIWNEKRTFSKAEAWVDIVQSVRFEAAPARYDIGGREVNIAQGQMPASHRSLSERWGWTEKKVRVFLKVLETDGAITIDSTRGITIITLSEHIKGEAKGRGKGRGKGEASDLSVRDLHTTKGEVKGAPKGEIKGAYKKKDKEQEEYIYLQEEKNKTKKEEVSSQPDMNRILPLSLQQCKAELEANKSWKNDVLIAKHGRGFHELDEAALDRWLGIYFQGLAERMQYSKSVQDAAHHFSNWLNIELEKQKQKQKNDRPQANQAPSPTRNNGEGQVSAPESFYF